MPRGWWVGMVLALLQADAGARQAVAPVEPAPVQLATVVVSGVQPGPAMWKVSRDGHVLWVLGTLSPLPRGVRWESREVDAVLAEAQELLWAPSFTLKADVGFFQGLMLAPKALGARRNPDGRSLQQVVPAALYARWVPLKQRYLGRDRGVEQWRPLFAADALYDAALDREGLTRKSPVVPVIARAAKARGLRTTTPRFKLVVADPKAAIAEFRQASLPDIDCFDATLARLETDMDGMRQRANAWAVGDVQALRSLPYRDNAAACMQAAMGAAAMRKRGPADLDSEMRRLWLDAARRALAQNTVTLALLPMQELVKPQGYLSALEAEGYTVEAPE